MVIIGMFMVPNACMHVIPFVCSQVSWSLANKKNAQGFLAVVKQLCGACIMSRVSNLFLFFS